MNDTAGGRGGGLPFIPVNLKIKYELFKLTDRPSVK